MEWTTVIITNVIHPTKTAFAVREDNSEDVFIPPAVSKRLGLEIGDIVLAKIVPNRNMNPNAGSRPPVPWIAPLMARTHEDVLPPQSVKAALSPFEYPVTAEEAELPLVALEQAYQAGDIVKVIVMPSPRAERVIMWAADMDRV
jgi:antitoxin component of MazEF toxin-antitoxin module